MTFAECWMKGSHRLGYTAIAHLFDQRILVRHHVYVNFVTCADGAQFLGVSTRSCWAVRRCWESKQWTAERGIVGVVLFSAAQCFPAEVRDRRLFCGGADPGICVREGGGPFLSFPLFLPFPFPLSLPSPLEVCPLKPARVPGGAL